LAVEPGTTELDPDNLLELDTILSVCGGLVILNAEDDRVCLIHYTTQRYLDCIPDREFPHVQSQITTICITYLLFDAFSPSRLSTLDNSLFLPAPLTHHLLNYALNYGLVHARGQPESNIKDIILAFLAQRSRWLGLWNRVYYYNKIPELATNLWIAAFFDLREIAGHLIVAEGLDVGAVYAASVNGHAEMVGILIGAGAQVNSFGGYHGTALQVAALTGNEDMVRLLLKSGADVNMQTKRHNSALYEASRRGYETIVRLLTENGADVNIQTEEHGTALQMASHGGHQEIVRLLITNGADVNIQSKEQLTGTALQMASIEGHQEIIRMLIENGADVNFQTKERGSALYGASLTQNDAAVALLIKHGADVNAKGPDGTALQVASADGNEKIVRLLLANGANVDVEGPNGTALQAALSERHTHIVRLLVKYGADVKKTSQSQRGDDFTLLLIPHAVPPNSWHQSGNLLRQKSVLHRRTSWS
jgi:ankyrin repeat protein